MNFLRGHYSLAVAIGAIFGALSRFYITEATKIYFGDNFSFYATFLINISGCSLIAYVLTLATEQIRKIAPELRLMITTGFCGAYTTFSAYSLEAHHFLTEGHIATMLIYWLGSAIAGITAVWIGVFFARFSSRL